MRKTDCQENTECLTFLFMGFFMSFLSVPSMVDLQILGYFLSHRCDRIYTKKTARIIWVLRITFGNTFKHWNCLKYFYIISTDWKPLQQETAILSISTSCIKHRKQDLTLNRKTSLKSVYEIQPKWLYRNVLDIIISYTSHVLWLLTSKSLATNLDIHQA